MQKIGRLLSVASIALTLSFAPLTAIADTQPWPHDCLVTNSGLVANSVNLIDEVRLFNLYGPLLRKIKTLSKSDKEIVRQVGLTLKKMSELGNFNCDAISETFWNEIKNERIKNISEVNSQALSLITQLQAIQGQTITCYKDGSTRSILGKNPECPKGFVKTR
jgi:hypothetical protein